MRLGEQTPSLVCPGCGKRSDPQQRFCATCALPLVRHDLASAQAPVSERHARVRKIKPQLTEGALVQTAWAHNQAEAEFIQGLLLEEGIPSVLRRSAGFDVPDMLAAGPRDIMVAQSGVATAREVLLQARVIEGEATEPAPHLPTTPKRLLAGLVAALALVALVIWLLGQMIH